MASATPTSFFIPPSSSGTGNVPSSSSSQSIPALTAAKRPLPNKDYYIAAPAFSLKSQAPAGLSHFGPFNIEQNGANPIPLETGRTITAAYPVKAVPGLDLTVNMFAGHRDTNTGSNVGTGALTVGMRVKW